MLADGAVGNGSVDPSVVAVSAIVHPLSSSATLPVIVPPRAVFEFDGHAREPELEAVNAWR